MNHELPARVDFDWYRKQAKALVRAYRAGEPGAVERVEEILVDRARERFGLSDAQWVIAQEHGFRTWADFKSGAGSGASSVTEIGGTGLAAAFDAAHATWGERGEALLDSGLTFEGITPVRIRVTKRVDRYLFTDDGAAVQAAGRPSGWLAEARRVVTEHWLNVSRAGAVFVPATSRSGPDWLSSLPARVAAASAAVYSALLDLDDG